MDRYTILTKISLLAVAVDFRSIFDRLIAVLVGQG